MQTWTQAVKAYETALELRPDDADSKFNRDFREAQDSGSEAKAESAAKIKINPKARNKDRRRIRRNSRTAANRHPASNRRANSPPGQQPPGQTATRPANRQAQQTTGPAAARLNPTPVTANPARVRVVTIGRMPSAFPAR